MKNRERIEKISENQACALMTICSTSALHTMFANLLDPVCIFQNLGGALPTRSDDSGWGTVEYAIEQLGLRQILLCGHSRCTAPSMRSANSQIHATVPRTANGPDSAAKLKFDDATLRSQRWLTEQIYRLSSFLDRTVHRPEITLHALWFNDDRGTLFMWSSTSERFEPADNQQIRRLLDLLSMSSERTQEVLSQLKEFSRMFLSGDN